jgi:N-acetylmuramoyl-L-alanine amidase
MNVSEHLNKIFILSAIAIIIMSGAALCKENGSAAAGYRAVIFSGHIKDVPGKKPSGATSFGKRPEVYFNDTIAIRFETVHTGEIEFIVFRSSDNIPLKLRPVIAERVKAGACVEIHHDSAQKEDILKKRWKDMEGFSLFFYSGNESGTLSLELARAIGDEMIKSGFKPNHYHAKKIRGENMTEIDSARAIYDRDLFITLHAKVPTVLIECGCIESPDEEKMLLDPETSRKISGAIADGIESYFKSAAVNEKKKDHE